MSSSDVSLVNASQEPPVITTKDLVQNEYIKMMRSYGNVNRKIRNDRIEGKRSTHKNYKSEFTDVLNKFKEFVTKHPGSKYTPAVLSRIAGSLLILDDSGELSAYMQHVIGNSRMQNLRPYAQAALISKQIKSGNYKEAVASYEGLIKTYPSHSMVVEWLYGEGLVYKHQLKNQEQANSIFAGIIKDYPNHPTALSAKDEMGIAVEKPFAKQATEETTSKEFTADNYPNPFNPSTVIRFTLPESGLVVLKVYDILGREIKTLINSIYNEGNHETSWNGKDNVNVDAPSGIYIYSIQFNNNLLNKKMILLR